VVVAVANKLLDLIPADKKTGQGIKLRLEKNMKIGTGMGSSAASGVAAAVCINELFGKVFKQDAPELLQSVIYGEFVACGAAHSGNALPCLIGGPTIILDSKTLEHTHFRTPELYIVLVSPDLVVTTRDARRLLWESPYDIPKLIQGTQRILKKYLELGKLFEIVEADYRGIAKEEAYAATVKNYLTGSLEVIHGFINDDIDLIGKGLERDSIVTAVRSTLIKGFDSVKKAAVASGAKAFCISGSGPALFALARTAGECTLIGDSMVQAFKKEGVEATKYISQINPRGAYAVY